MNPRRLGAARCTSSLIGMFGKSASQRSGVISVKSEPKRIFCFRALLTFVWVDFQHEPDDGTGFRGTPPASRPSSLRSSASPSLDPSGFPRSWAPMARKPTLPGWAGRPATDGAKRASPRGASSETIPGPLDPAFRASFNRFSHFRRPHERQERRIHEPSL
jgi:hypothetical protein